MSPKDPLSQLPLPHILSQQLSPYRDDSCQTSKINAQDSRTIFWIKKAGPIEKDRSSSYEHKKIKSAYKLLLTKTDSITGIEVYNTRSEIFRRFWNKTTKQTKKEKARENGSLYHVFQKKARVFC
jgi:hypothetical protein